MQNKRKKFPIGTRYEVWKKYGGRCAYCGAELTNLKDMQIDHLHPIQKGGSNELENLMPACRSCNHYKESYIIDQFRERMSKTLDNFHNSPLARLATRYGTIQQGTQWNKKFYFEIHP